MSRYLIYIYLGLVFVILGIIQVGIRTEGGPPIVDLQSDPKKEGYVPMSRRVEEVAEQSKKAEAVVRETRLGEAFEKMIFIPPGEFVMGSVMGPHDQEPVRTVFLDGYEIDQFEVTFSQYYEFVRLAGHRKPRLAGYLSGRVMESLPLLIFPEAPVVGVAWADAQEYCRWKGKRLPTEAEWEKAARGTDGRTWPWGNEERSEYANLVGDDPHPFSAPVNQLGKDVSPYGVHGMAGNVMEWTADWYNQDSYRLAPARNPVGVRMGEQRVIRGASWHDSIKRAMTSVRFKMYPEYRDVTIGFRCARTP